MDAKVLLRDGGNALYTPAQMAEIQRVIRAFYNYLRDSETCELVWSDKVGYLFFTIGCGKRRSVGRSAVVHNADELIRFLLAEISRESRADAGICRFFRRNRAGIRRRADDYMAQLPEYQEYFDAVLRAG